MDVMEEDLKTIVKYLFRAIGRNWTIYCSGLDYNHKMKRFRFARIPIDVEMRLRYAYQAILLVKEAYGKEALREWMSKRNPNLNWKSPADTLRYSDNLRKLSQVIEAAQKFVVSC